MPDSSGRSKCRTAATLLAAVAGFAVLPAQSAAATHDKAPSAAVPVNPASISNSLKRQTGYPASQLTTKPVCGAPKPGQMTCLSRILVVKSTGKPAGLLQTPHASPMQVTRHDSLAPAAISADQSATTAPVSGTAGFLQWAYDTTWLSANRGSSDTVAIIDAYDDPNAASDLATFRSANGLPACAVGTCFNQYNQSGQLIDQSGAIGSAPTQDPTGGWEVEESLDLDAVSSLCPLCKILLVEANSDDGGGSPDLETAAATAARLGANQISMSFGGPGSPDFAANDDWSFTNVASLAAAGDNGYLGSHTVSYPAAGADVTAVGGTALSTANDARGFGESVWNSYGGATGSGCDTSQSVPTYQMGITTDCIGRAYNDVSADADPGTGLNVYDTFGGSAGLTGWYPVGGTSLATPLAAAYEAVAGVTPTPSPAWAYSDAALLNDIVSGYDGSCPSGAFLICNAGSGWDGPTGNGSISGDIATGGPGIGAQPDASPVGTDYADVSGAIDPNDALLNANATYFWQYGPTTSYGQTTVAQTLSPSKSYQAVSGTLPNLLPCTYHYRLEATNPIGTVYGYDNTVTPTASTTVPANTTPPTISGTAEVGQQLSAQPGGWTPDCDSAVYQWQESPSAAGAFNDITGATAAAYTPTTADTGGYIRVHVAESDSAGPGDPVPSQAVGPVTTPPVTTTTTTTPTTTTPTKPRTTKTVRFYRCAHTCTLLNTHGATTYKPQRADDGKYIKVVTTVRRAGAAGAAPTVTTRSNGPITASRAGDVTISGTAHVASALTVKGRTHATLARVRLKKRTSRALILAVTRHGKATTSVWAYVIKEGAVVSCTRSHSLARPVRLSVPATRGETVKLVAVRA